MIPLFADSSARRAWFKDPGASFQAMRTLGLCSSDAAELGECWNTIQKIRENDDESWYTQWNSLAERIEKEAYSCLDKGHTISASTQLSRASNYYRTAELFLRDNIHDPRINITYQKSIDCFSKASTYFSHPLLRIEIPFEQITLPGILCLVDTKTIKRPLLIGQMGFDGTKEELYFRIGKAALKRGYNCLFIEGPGQGNVLRKNKIPFRHNWETVISPIIDFAYSLPEIDREKIALLGVSLGGHLICRALAFEHRIKTAIAISGAFDFHAVCVKDAHTMIENALSNDIGSKMLNAVLFHEMKNNQFLRWGIRHGMFCFGTQDPSSFLKQTKMYTLKNSIHLIQAKILVIDSNLDFQMREQSRILFENLSCPKEYKLFTKEEGAGDHCQIAAASLCRERILNWLDEQLFI